MTGRVILLCGLPGSGKTTEARRLVVERGAVRMCPDEWMAALDIDLWDQPARARVEALQWSLTLRPRASRVDSRHRVGVVSCSDDVARADRAAGAAVELRFLDVARDELWRRVAGRNERPAIGWTRIDRPVARGVVGPLRSADR